MILMMRRQRLLFIARFVTEVGVEKESTSKRSNQIFFGLSRH